jgi:hypothetical protein
MPAASSSLHLGFRRAGHIKALGGWVVACPSVLADDSTYRWRPGQSLFHVEPQTVGSLVELGLHPASPHKRFYDRLRKRGTFAAP